MTSMALPDIEVHDMSAFEFEPEVPCDWEHCSNPAAGYLICGICFVSRECECKEHRAASIEYTEENPFWGITFSTSCRHTPLYMTCGWEPLTF